MTSATASASARCTVAPQRVSRRASSEASSEAGATISMALPPSAGAAKPGALGIFEPRQRQRDTERRALARPARHADPAAHAFDDAPRNREAKAGAAELAVGAAFGLLELQEDARLLLGRDADAGVAHLEHDLVAHGARLDHDADATGLGELDRIAGEVEQHLAQACGIAGDALRQRLVDVGGDFEALGLRAGPEQLDHLLDQSERRERTRLEVELAGLDLGEVEDFLDQREQCVARGLCRLDVGGLLRGQRRVEQQIGHAEDAVERRADLVRHRGEEPRLGTARRLGGVARLGERAAGLGAFGDVAADALHLAAAARRHEHHRLAPGEPARPVRRVDLLVVHARAVGHHADLALFERGQGCRRCHAGRRAIVPPARRTRRWRR